MGKSRNTRGNKEYSREQRLIHENRELKRALAKLRKQLERIDLDRYQEIKEIVDRSYAAENEAASAQVLADLRKIWSCHECGKGVMEICLYSRLNETWYYRHCNCCSHRTKSQKYDPESVNGIIREPPEPKQGK